MNLAEKMKHLRTIEGELRGLNRPMTQIEVVKAMQLELGETVSQAYLSQLERNKRHHLTAPSRDKLSRFFKVHPSYLISDPPDFSTDLLTEVEQDEDRLPTWLATSANEWRGEPALADLLQDLAKSSEPRRYLELFSKLMSLSPEELEAIVNTFTSVVNGPRETSLFDSAQSITALDLERVDAELLSLQLDSLTQNGYLEHTED
jgi:transcriptional regulator with XRE-family HTH domain